MCKAGFPSGSALKSVPVVQELQDMWVRSLGQKDPWRRECDPPSFLSLRIPWTEEPGGRQSMGSQRVGHSWSHLAASVLRECAKPVRRGRQGDRRSVPSSQGHRHSASANSGSSSSWPFLKR